MNNSLSDLPSHPQFCTWEEAVQWLIEQPHQQKLVAACYYDQPHQAAADRYWKSDEWQSIRQYLPPQSGHALDVGAGNGISSYALAKDGWKVIALEPDPSHLVGVGAICRLAEINHLPITVTQEFGENLPFPEATFDCVFARQVLHHAQNLPQLCLEIQRVLKPGGKFIAVRDHVVSQPEDLSKFFEIHPLHKLYGGENAYQLGEYIAAIQKASLKLDHIIGSFASVINYAPYSKAELKLKFQKKSEKFLLGKLASGVLGNDIFFELFLRVLNKVDQRPGRLYSFIAHKPNEGI